MCVCVRVCVCLLVVFCHHAHVDPKISVPTGSQQRRLNFYNHVLFLLKMLGSEATASFACLRCHQLHLNPKRRIPKGSAEGWKDIDSRDLN